MLDKVIFRQVGPTAMLYIVRRALVIVINRHRFALHREFINATRANSRSRFATQDDTLRQFLVIDLIAERTVVEARHIHHGSKVIVDYRIRIVHTLCYRTRRILAMANVLQEESGLAFTLRPLVRHLITDTPHHDTRIVAIVTDQIHQVFFYPFVEEEVITILTLGHAPLVKALSHHHHTHLITGTHQLRCRHVV